MRIRPRATARKRAASTAPTGSLPWAATASEDISSTTILSTRRLSSEAGSTVMRSATGSYQRRRRSPDLSGRTTDDLLSGSRNAARFFQDSSMTSRDGLTQSLSTSFGMAFFLSLTEIYVSSKLASSGRNSGAPSGAVQKSDVDKQRAPSATARFSQKRSHADSPSTARQARYGSSNLLFLAGDIGLKKISRERSNVLPLPPGPKNSLFSHDAFWFAEGSRLPAAYDSVIVQTALFHFHAASAAGWSRRRLCSLGVGPALCRCRRRSRVIFFCFG